MITSGIRIGSPAMTSRGLKEKDFIQIARIMDKALRNLNDDKVYKELLGEVKNITKKYPLWY
jgi:glycine hydroxymethyltransferase